MTMCKWLCVVKSYSHSQLWLQQTSDCRRMSVCIQLKKQKNLDIWSVPSSPCSNRIISNLGIKFVTIPSINWLQIFTIYTKFMQTDYSEHYTEIVHQESVGRFQVENAMWKEFEICAQNQVVINENQ